MIAKTTGPTGPRGASGPQGEPGNLALANTACDQGQFVSGFDGDGDPLCGVVDDSGGWRIGLISLAPFTTSRASVDFGEVPVGSRATETITITNQNPQFVRFQWFSPTFPIGADCQSGADGLSPGGRCVVDVVFEPHAAGKVVSTLMFLPERDFPTVVPLIGVGTAN